MPILIFVIGLISLSINESKFIGNNILGILRFKFPPSSNKLKNESLGIPISFDAPIEFLKFILKFSVPLNMFLISSIDPTEIPKSSIFECVRSTLKPRENLFLGIR